MKPSQFSLLHFVQPLARRPDYATRMMFGTLAIYLGDATVLCLAERPGNSAWNGLMIATDRAHHESLRAEFPALVPHPVVSKWLYLPQSEPDFESVAETIVGLIRRGDPRIGVIAKPKRRKAKKPAPKPVKAAPAKKKAKPAPRRKAPARARK